MLVLSRKSNEWTDLTLPDGREINIGVVAIEDDRVRLGFDAPKEVRILRREITAAIKREERRAKEAEEKASEDSQEDD